MRLIRSIVIHPCNKVDKAVNMNKKPSTCCHEKNPISCQMKKKSAEHHL